MAMTILENNSTPPLISIGMPVYNGAGFIGVALQSLLDQSYQNFELIVSDNGSTDSTPSICEKFAEKDARVKYIRHKENRGAIENFNYVLDQARGKYFMWAASDDQWDRGWVEALVPLMTDSVGLAFGQLRTIDGLGNILREYPIREFSTNPLHRSLQYFLREETLGKTNLIYGLWRRDLLSPIPSLDGPNRHKTPTGADMLHVFNLIQRHHVAVAGGVYFYKRQIAPSKAPYKERLASSVLMVRRIPVYLECIRSARDISLKLIMCLLVLPKYAVSVCFNVGWILASRISPRQLNCSVCNSLGAMTNEADIGTRFDRAVHRFHASPLQKLFLVGPKRFMARKWARWSGTRMERVAELFFGGSMTVVLPEVISEQIYSYGFFDEIVTGVALRAVREGDVVIDVGAHFGYFTLLFAHLVGESGRVVSFEPTPSTFSVLRKNTVALKNVTSLNMAAGRQSGQLTISDFGLTYCAWNTLSGSSRMPKVLVQPKARVEVAVIRLDDWCKRESIRPDVIKIDAENFEAEVIGGLAETLLRSRPRVLMETGSEQAVKAGNALMDLDYRMFTSNQPGVLTLQKDGIEDALIRNKDVLFVPAAQVGKFMGSA